MPSSPARNSPAPRPPHKPQMPTSPRRTQSYSPRSPQPYRSPAHPPTNRRNTTPVQPRARGYASPLPAYASSPSRRRMSPSPAPSKGSQHVLIPVPIRAKDAESPVFIRAPSGQHVDFVFPAPKKRGLLGRLLDSVEWGDPEENKPYRYRKPSPKPAATRPFYKKLLS